MFIHVLLPLIIGVLIFYYFTDRDMFFNRLIEKWTGSKGHVDWNSPAWIYNHLPDGIWSYSFASAMLIIYDGQWNREAVFMLGIAITIPLANEFAQKINILQGTYDPLDLIWYICGAFFSLLIHNYKPLSS
ncbi:MAG: hypothetical protein HKN79_01810 [Flavobacteriales bacterium]|nr:hypothetical protein [Flavobacteriales bacterium]